MTGIVAISILPVLSKVFERVILSQISTFIDRQCIYKSTQSGYRPGHSCITLLLELRDDIQKAMNRGEITVAVLADYSKAFDTVDYRILLSKLHNLNFSESVLCIIHSYVTERKQFVQVDDKLSANREVMYGVPHGSILGPILFNLYVQDMSNNTKSSCLQFADDIDLYHHCKFKELNTCVKTMESDLNSLMTWSASTNLIFNRTKTKSMLFSTTQMSRKHNLTRKEICNIQCNDES